MESPNHTVPIKKMVSRTTNIDKLEEQNKDQIVTMDIHDYLVCQIVIRMIHKKEMFNKLTDWFIWIGRYITHKDLKHLHWLITFDK